MKRKERLPVTQLLIDNAALIIAITLILFGFAGLFIGDYSMMCGLLSVGFTFGVIHFGDT